MNVTRPLHTMGRTAALRVSDVSVCGWLGSTGTGAREQLHDGVRCELTSLADARRARLLLGQFAIAISVRLQQSLLQLYNS